MMNKIDGQSKTVRQLLDNVKYAIDDYQREYQWTTKNVEELIEALEAKFTSEYSPEHERI
jgi:uncharacterized protein with ParB-like and HNH nuclease domain